VKRLRSKGKSKRKAVCKIKNKKNVIQNSKLKKTEIFLKLNPQDKKKINK